MGDYFHRYIYILRDTIYIVVMLKMNDNKREDERTLFIRAVLVRNKVSAVDSLRLRFCGFDCFDELVLYHKAVIDANKRVLGDFVKEVRRE